MKKRVLYVLDYFYPHRWGIETVFGQITTHFSDIYDVTVLTSRFDDSLASYERENNVHIIRVCRGRMTFMLFGWFFGRLYFMKQKSRFDLIHTSTYGWAFSGWMLSFWLRIPVVLTIHEVFWTLWFRYKWYIKWLFYRLWEIMLFSLPFDYYHSVSLFTFNSVRLLYGISDTKHCMIYNGVDNDFWKKWVVSTHDIASLREKLHWWDRYVVLYYGHTGVSKWIDLLVKSIPTLVAQYPDILIVFNLIPAKRDVYIKSCINAYNLHKNVYVYNWFDLMDLRTLVAASDVVVAPSLSEWFGSVHAEVSALWQNLITTHYTAIPEVVSGNVYFMPSWDIQSLLEGVRCIKEKNIDTIPMKRFERKASMYQFASLYALFM